MKLILCLGVLTLANVLAWYQLNGQFYWKDSSFWTNPYVMSVFGFPVGLGFFIATRLSYEHFGHFWNIRMIGFGLGTIIFGIMTWTYLKEIPTLKTFICILLALAIILIQVTNVWDK